MHAIESGEGELTHWSQVDETSSRPVSRTCAKIQEENDQINVNGYPYLTHAKARVEKTFLCK